MTLSTDLPAAPAVPRWGRLARRALVPALLALAAVQFWLVAWLSDDILITLRQVERFTAGEGMVWNPGQRVQAFTHAAWFWILSAGTFVLRPLHPEAMYLWTLAASALCWGGALILWARLVLARGWDLAPTALALILPLLPLAIRDYTSSGLETPLSFLLAMAIVTARGTALWTLMALAVLTRPDHAVQFGPLALWLLASRGFRWRELAPGSAMLLGWLGFAAFYFGSPLPNTYFAKAEAGLGWEVLWPNYVAYWTDAAAHLPVTLLMLFGGLAAALRWGDARARALAVGVALHLAYLATIGSDFMRGRFLAVDTLLVLALAVRHAPPAPVRWAGAACLLLAAGLTRPWLAPVEGRPMEVRDIVDERAVYAQPFALRSAAREWPAPHAAGPAPEHALIRCGLAGATRLRLPDTFWVVDSCGLTDPFIARLPGIARTHNRPGHVYRFVPADYHRMLLDGAPAPLGLDPLWRDTQLASRAPLTAPGRWAAIWRLWTHDYERADAAMRHGDPALVHPRTGYLGGEGPYFEAWPARWGPSITAEPVGG
ncbi:MAG: hypothetical protein ACU0BS_14150 [Hasllibacter sp.]